MKKVAIVRNWGLDTNGNNWNSIEIINPTDDTAIYYGPKAGRWDDASRLPPEMRYNIIVREAQVASKKYL